MKKLGKTLVVCVILVLWAVTSILAVPKSLVEKLDRWLYQKGWTY